MKRQTILDKIGNTPLLGLSHIKPENPNVSIYFKAEWCNPGGSVKDRPAYNMVCEAEKNNLFNKDKILIDSSSGNTAIAYAMICAAKSYRCLLVMPSNISEERKKIVEAFGAGIVYTDPMEGSDGAIREAHRLYEMDKDKYFMPDQYNNINNPLAHKKSTAREIIEQTDGQVTHFAACIGTSGTVMGTSLGLKEYNPDIKTYAIEPANPLHGLEGMKHMASSIVPGIYKIEDLDGVISVQTEKAYDMVGQLAKKEGLLVGQSSGAALVGALELSNQIDKGLIVSVFCDGGDKYLSTNLWD